MAIKYRFPFIIYLLFVTNTCKTISTKTDYPALYNYISVKNFGAIGNGINDDTRAFKQALENCKSSSILRINNTNAGPRGTGILHIPKGIYKITETIELKHFNGLRIIGDGIENTVIVYSKDEACLFDCDQLINFSIENIEIENGIVKLTNNNKIYIDNFLNSKAICFEWNGNSGDRFLKFQDVLCTTKFEYFWIINGSTTHSEVSYIRCTFLNANNIIKLNNPQSVNHSFHDCNFELNSGKIFTIKAGGFINIYGGSIVLVNDLFYFDPSPHGIGIHNNQYTITNTRIELSNSRNLNNAPMIVNSVSTTNCDIFLIK
ncbi:MAG: glycosyl hydrolase family 28-related protein [Saprospiraceae bacterium]